MFWYSYSKWAVYTHSCLFLLQQITRNYEKIHRIEFLLQNCRTERVSISQPSRKLQQSSRQVRYCKCIIRAWLIEVRLRVPSVYTTLRRKEAPPKPWKWIDNHGCCVGASWTRRGRGFLLFFRVFAADRLEELCRSVTPNPPRLFIDFRYV